MYLCMRRWSPPSLELNVSALLWCLWMWQNTLRVNASQVEEPSREKRVSLSQDLSSAHFFYTWKCLLAWIWNSKPLCVSQTRIIRKNTGISHFFSFLMSNISLVSAVTGEQLFPSRRQDRRHPIMNTQANKYNLPSSLHLSMFLSFCL